MVIEFVGLWIVILGIGAGFAFGLAMILFSLGPRMHKKLLNCRNGAIIWLFTCSDWTDVDWISS